MYEELVKRLRKKGCQICPICREAADAIEELSKINAKWEEVVKTALDFIPCWVPVTEEPPLKVGDDGYNGYLVYANGYYEAADYTIDKFDNAPHFHVNGEYEPDVTHYMPLPEPPKEES